MLLDLLFPKTCLGCGSISQYLCDNCTLKIKRHKQICIACSQPSKDGITHTYCKKYSSIEVTIIATEYNQLMKKIIHQIKYRMSFQLINDLCNYVLIADKIKSTLIEYKPEIVSCIGLHRYRANWRGFNVSEKIARWVECTYKIPYQELIVKNIITTPQAGQSKNDRLFNQVNSFSLKPNAQTLVKGKTVLLTDDVTTTGQTFEQAAKIIKDAGASKILVLALSGH